MAVYISKRNIDRSRQGGFTLIEVMVAMVILGIGLLSITALQSREMLYNNSSKRQTQSYTWAMDFSERLMSEPWTSARLSTGSGKTLDTAADATLITEMDPYTLTWDVADGTITGTKRINVYVQYNGREVARIDLTRSQESI